MHPSSIIGIVKSCCKGAGTEHSYAFSSHSLRRGLAIWANDHRWEEKINLLDMAITGERWLNLNHQFGPLSDFDSRIEDPFLRFVLTLLCYETNNGPTETAGSVKGISRKQMAWISLKRTTEERLDKAIAKDNNAYKKYCLTECWGSGKSVSADDKL